MKPPPKKDIELLIDAIDKIAKRYLESPNVSDANMEPANLVDAIFLVSRSIGWVSKQMQGSGRVTQAGNPATFADAFFAIADALSDGADALYEVAAAIRETKKPS
jgi:hypothetical protein